MKRLILTAALLWSVFASAQIDVTSKTDGIIIDTTATATLNALVVKPLGLFVFNKELLQLQYWNGSQWTTIPNANSFVSAGSVSGNDLTLTVPGQSDVLIDVTSLVGGGGGGDPDQTLSFSSPNLTLSKQGTNDVIDISAIDTKNSQSETKANVDAEYPNLDTDSTDDYDGSDAVKLTGDQDILGTKSFRQNPWIRTLALGMDTTATGNNSRIVWRDFIGPTNPFNTAIGSNDRELFFYDSKLGIRISNSNEAEFEFNNTAKRIYTFPDADTDFGNLGIGTNNQSIPDGNVRDLSLNTTQGGTSGNLRIVDNAVDTNPIAIFAPTGVSLPYLSGNGTGVLGVDNAGVVSFSAGGGSDNSLSEADQNLTVNRVIEIAAANDLTFNHDGTAVMIVDSNVDFPNEPPTIQGAITGPKEAATKEYVDNSSASSSKSFLGTRVTQDTTITETAFLNSKSFFWQNSANDIEITVNAPNLNVGQYATFSQEKEGRFLFDVGVAYPFASIDSTSVVNLMRKGTGLKPNAADVDYSPVSFTPNPGTGNPNPELVDNDASTFVDNNATADFEPTGFHAPVGVSLSAFADTSHGYATTQVLRITADSDGTLKRDRMDFDHVTWENGESYDVTIVHKENNTNDSFRFRTTLGTTDGDHSTFVAATTAWKVTSFTFLSDGTDLRLEVHPRNDALTNEYSDVLISIRKTDD